jgi:hypothetical protein
MALLLSEVPKDVRSNPDDGPDEHSHQKIMIRPDILTKKVNFVKHLF